ncbi:sulfite reductase [Betaproteobacteria bacterium]|nr:sulfite reductase [Betaproteobacteria bacterium]GHU00850.1 sulfite reductase [Betaproteobacteria bacterium]GHU15879.1 sulfite reductase [Betaproteobacteria bacterium]
MYRYDAYDQALVDARVTQFRDQTRRYLAGELSEDEYRPLRLQNGLYVQRHAPMLRIALPYGLLDAHQLRTLARLARDYDKGYGHISTRQNLQLNWLKLADVPEVLAELAKVGMHAIQTSGSCIRSITADHFAGIAPDEHVDPRPFAEILRQWTSLHPEFALLPRKFKFAVSGATHDRAALSVHDVGLTFHRDDSNEVKVRVQVGGGLGRNPAIAEVLHEDLPWQHLLTYAEAILRVYNRYGRRDNMYKARIKILTQSLGIAQLRAQVDAEWAPLKDGPSTLTDAELQRVAAFFAPPPYEKIDEAAAQIELQRHQDAHAHTDFPRWVARCVHPHRQPGYRAVTLSLKRPDSRPGDFTSSEMDAIATLAERYSFGLIRTTHSQNLVLGEVRVSDLFALWQALRALHLATPNTGLLTDMICCPGGDLCGLANARSVPIATALQERFADLDRLFDLGEIELNISGCINSCSHHHIAHIGILGVDKDNTECYQVSLGGNQGTQARLGRIIGHSFTAAEIPQVVEKIIATFVARRQPGERFIDTYQRIGAEPFVTQVYGDEAGSRARKEQKYA